MALFKSDPQLSYPNFNTYRLDSEIGPQNITTTDISPHYATASRVSHSQQLSFKEVQARIGWDHLAVGPNSQDVCYIDEDYNVIRVTIDVSTTFCSDHRLDSPLNLLTFRRNPTSLCLRLLPPCRSLCLCQLLQKRQNRHPNFPQCSHFQDRFLKFGVEYTWLQLGQVPCTLSHDPAWAI